MSLGRTADRCTHPTPQRGQLDLDRRLERPPAPREETGARGVPARPEARGAEGAEAAVNGGTLPNGKVTRSDRVYVAAWRKYVKVIVQAFNEMTGEKWHVIGWDPGV